MKKSDLKKIIKEELQKILTEETTIDSEGNIVYNLGDADRDYSDSSEILLTWETDDIDSETKEKLRKFEWDIREDSIYTYIDVDELKEFIKNPVESVKNFEVPGGYVPITKEGAADLMDSYYENFSDEVDPDLN